MERLAVARQDVNGQLGVGGTGPAHWRTANVLIQLIVGAVVVAAGVTLTAAAAFLPENTAWGIKIGASALGNFLIPSGTVLLSWVIARAISAREAQREFDGELDVVSQNLGQIYVQLANAVELAEAGSYGSTETPFALIDQTAAMVRGQVTQIQKRLGREFESEPIVATKKALDGLTRVLYSDEGVDREKAEELVLEAKTALSRLGESSPLPVRVDETVACPACATETTIALSTFSGATRPATCETCGSRFNVHRRGDGSVYLRLVRAGGAEDRQAIEFECECGSLIRSWYRPGGSQSKFLMCTRCARLHEVSLPDERPLSTRQFETVDGVVVGRSAMQPVTMCPSCKRTFRCAMHDRGQRAYFGFCLTDDLLIRVTYEARDAWLAEVA